LYGHQPARSDVHRAYRVPKYGAATTITTLFSFYTSKKNQNQNQHEISKTQTPIEPLIASLAHPLSSRLGQAVDILVFNPPYVPTSDDEAGAAQHGAGIA
jgi:hypothetical protein